MTLYDPDEPELDVEALTDEELLALLDEVPEPDEPRGRPVIDVDIPIDQYPPARTEGNDHHDDRA